MPVPEEPVVFNKFPSAISDPFGDVVLDEETSVCVCVCVVCVCVCACVRVCCMH